MTPEHVRAAVSEHVAAFNAHDTERLLAGFAPDAVWRTGTDTCRGTAELADLFDDFLWAMQPVLTVRSVVADASRAAVELHEELVTEGDRRSFAVAGFFVLIDGLIVEATIYREGSADL